jgi:hypothetical protein
MRIIILVVVVLVAGCSGGDDATTLSSAPPGEGIPGLFEEAKAAGADERQLASLSDSEITFDEYEAGMQRAFTCIRDAGIDVVELGIDESRGFPLLSYAVAASAPGFTDDETVAVTTDCIVRFGKFVDIAWQMNSDESVEVNDARWDRVRAPLLECLADAGEDLPADASRTEMLASSQQIMDSGGVDCLSEVDFFGG